MMREGIVTNVGYSSTKKCITIEYESNSEDTLTAAVAEMLSLKVGDKVWILNNSDLNYKGFNAVAVLIA